MKLAIETIRDMGIFSMLPDELLADFESGFEEQTYHDGSEILRHGDVGKSLFFIASGRVKVEMPGDFGPVTLAHLGRGETFGEISLLTGNPITATVRAEGEVMLVQLPKKTLLEILERYPPLSRHFIEILSQRLASTDISVRHSEEKKAVLSRFLEESSGMDEFDPGKSRVMEAAADFIKKASAHKCCLITGERGLGKAALARTVHRNSPHSQKHFLVFTASGDDPDRIGNILFGDGDGKNRFGYLDLAENGTLVVKHPERLPLSIQDELAKRFKNGQSPPLPASLILVSGKDLDEMAKAGEFSGDLLELVEVSVEVPSLSKRGRELPDIINSSLDKLSKKHNVPRPEISRDALNVLLSHKYVDNLRELNTVLERALILCDGDVIEPECLFFGMTPVSRKGRLNLLSFDMFRVFWEKPAGINILRSLTVVFFLGLLALLLTGIAMPGSPAGRFSLGMIWGVWWPALIIAAFLLARFWCGICPINTMGGLFRKIGVRRRNPSDWMRKFDMYIPLGGYLVIVWAEELTGMQNSITGTFILLLSILAGYSIFALLYSRNTWCRYVCPLGGMLGVFASGGILEMRANPEVCAKNCRGHECFKGRAGVAGCPVFHHAMFLEDNFTCQVCGACIRSCGNNSVQLNLRPPGEEIFEYRSPMTGAAAFSIALALVPPLLILLEKLGIGAFSFPTPVPGFNFILVTVAVVAAGIGIFRLMSRLSGDEESSLTFTRLGLSLIPFALASNLAFHMLHIPAGGWSVNVDLNLLGAVGKTIPLVSLNFVFIIQAALLALGVLGTVYILLRDRRTAVIPRICTFLVMAALTAGMFFLLTAF
ncbi:MAG: cyclic nucleotide-binding domain-containing protein [Chloroflexi bacterium]|nr:cyclic nucleotide-binding domain-containing protein [Chloroflexota bacterium]